MRQSLSLVAEERLVTIPVPECGALKNFRFSEFRRPGLVNTTWPKRLAVPFPRVPEAYFADSSRYARKDLVIVFVLSSNIHRLVVITGA